MEAKDRMLRCSKSSFVVALLLLTTSENYQTLFYSFWACAFAGGGCVVEDIVINGFYY